MAKTYLQLVNTVLKRLREEPVSTVENAAADSYEALIGEFVNLTKDDLEQRHLWNQLRGTARILTSVGTFAYELDGLGFDYEIQSVWNDSQDYELKYGGFDRMNRWLNSALQHGAPQWYDINGSAGDDPVINLYPVPNTRDYININAVYAQAELSLDATEIIIPSRPVIEKALALALEERGEDDGARYDRQVQRAEQTALKYIHLDMMKWPEAYIWEVE